MMMLIDVLNVSLANLFYSLSQIVALTTRYSAVFLNGEIIGEPNSGNPGESKIQLFVMEMVVEVN